jgi:hypothetical protein
MSYTKKAAAFGKLVGICAGYEGKYNPARQNLTLNSIKSLEVQANAANLAVAVAEQNWLLSASTRQLAFNGLLDTVLKLRGEIISMELDPGTKKLLMSAINKVKGTGKAGNADPPAESGAEGKVVRRNTRKDFASRIAAYDQLLSILATTPDFVPSTPELTLEVLNKKSAEVKALGAAVTAAYAAMQESRSNRRQIFQKPVTGVLATALGVRYAVGSIFGRQSDELNTIKTVRF